MSGDARTPTSGVRVGARRLAGLVIGVAAIVAGTIVGANPALADAVLNGPPLLRAALTGIAFVVGLWLLSVSLTRLAGSEDDRGDGGALADAAALPGRHASRTFVDMIRGIRYAFLAVAAFAAASAFLLGSLLPLVVALVIAGVDVAETGLLLLVAQMHRDEDRPV
jgi:hypothetical protein